MSFRTPPAPITGYFFSAYRSTAVSVSANTLIAMTNGNDVSISAGRAVTSNRPVYVVGEVQVTTAGTYQLCDIKINENTGSKCEGYQIGNNRSGIIVMDDATYGIHSGPFTSLYLAEVLAGTFESDAYEARMMGVYTR